MCWRSLNTPRTLLSRAAHPFSLLFAPISTACLLVAHDAYTARFRRFVRLNNHEHTDIAEYMGSYAATPGGGLAFVEGALVTAVRNGQWLVLDELNLAPSDVLEALNRLLDDNRELFVPELQQTIVPHPHFLLFATQNPPGAYGGRKVCVVWVLWGGLGCGIPCFPFWVSNFAEDVHTTTRWPGARNAPGVSHST